MSVSCVVLNWPLAARVPLAPELVTVAPALVEVMDPAFEVNDGEMERAPPSARPTWMPWAAYETAWLPGPHTLAAPVPVYVAHVGAMSKSMRLVNGPVPEVFAGCVGFAFVAVTFAAVNAVAMLAAAEPPHWAKAVTHMMVFELPSRIVLTASGVHCETAVATSGATRAVELLLAPKR